MCAVFQNGFHQPQELGLLFLANHPQCDTARDIAALRELSKSQVSQAVDLLAAEGLLLRTPDREDRRIVHLSITPRGEPLARECQRLQVQCGRRLLEGLMVGSARENSSFPTVPLPRSTCR